jgi:hypothetical protein
MSETFAQAYGLKLVRNYQDLGVSAFRSTNREKAALGVVLAAAVESVESSVNLDCWSSRSTGSHGIR